MAEDLKIALIILTVYVTITYIVYKVQRFFFFHPEILPRSFKFKYNTPFEERFLKKGNIELNLLHFKAKNPKGVVLYFKGNTRSIKGWSKFRKDFIDAGYDYVIFDYPGFGKSKGDINEDTIYEGNQLVYSWLKEHFSEDNIIIYGRSLGAGFAVKVAADNNPKKVILDCPFYNINKLARYYTKILPLGLILKLQVPLNEYLKKVECPVYILHGDRDKTIPYRHSVLLEKESTGNVTLIPIPKGKHNNLPTISFFHETIKNILNT